MIKCFRIYDNTTEEDVEMSNCKTENQTLHTQACNLRPCGFLEWGAGYWSKVSEISLVMRKLFLVYTNNKDVNQPHGQILKVLSKGVQL